MIDTPSTNGRRILVAVVSGPPGDAIQKWRLRFDPIQAKRLPPHATLCYWAPDKEAAEALDLQIQHAFVRPVTVTLGGVHEFTNRDGTFFVEVTDDQDLDAARKRFYDGTHLTLAGTPDFTWHVTCIRYPDDSQRENFRAAARDLADELLCTPVWTIDTIAWLELRDGVYEPIRTWHIPH